MLIVEGPDGAGKTTLIAAIADYFGPAIELQGKVVDSDTNPMTDLKAWTEENLLKGFHRGLYDRHRLISEPIYGSLMRPREPAPGFGSPRWLWRMQELFRMIDPIIIWCLPPYEIVEQNILNDPENNAVKHFIPQMYNLYTHASANCASSVKYMYDYTLHSDRARATFLKRLRSDFEDRG